jgi:hypothetical protein
MLAFLALAFLFIDVCAVRATANPDVPAPGRVAVFRREIRQILVRGQAAASNIAPLLDIAEDGPLLPGWRQATDPQTYKAYYYNTESGEERDERPETPPSTPDATMVAAFDAALTTTGMAGQRTWEEAQQLEEEEEQQQQVAQLQKEQQQLDSEAKQKPQELREEQRWGEGEETEDTELNTIEEAEDTDLNTDRQQLRQLKDDTAAHLASELTRRRSEVGWKDGSALPSTVLLVASEEELGGEDSPDRTTHGLDFQSIPLQRMLQMARKSAGLAATERLPTYSI